MNIRIWRNCYLVSMMGCPWMYFKRNAGCDKVHSDKKKRFVVDTECQSKIRWRYLDSDNVELKYERKNGKCDVKNMRKILAYLPHEKEIF